MNTFIRLVFGTLSEVTSAAQNLFNEVVIGMLRLMLQSSSAMFRVAFSAIIDNDHAIHSHCTIGESVTNCANSTELNWFSVTYTRVVIVSAMILIAVTAVTVGKAAIFGGAASVAGIGLGRLPQAILMMVFVVPATMLALQVVDVASRIIAPDTQATIGMLDESLGELGAMDLTLVGGHSMVLIFFAITTMIGSIVVWLWMLFRTIGIYVLLAVFGFVAITNVTGGRASIQRWTKMLVVLIFSKVLIVTIMTLGVTAALSIGSVGEAFGQQAVEVAPPPTVDGEPLSEVDLERFSESAVGGQAVYQLATGSVLVWLAGFAPFLLMRILPDTWESTLRLEHGSAGARNAVRQRATRQVHRAQRASSSRIRSIGGARR